MGTIIFTLAYLFVGIVITAGGSAILEIDLDDIISYHFSETVVTILFWPLVLIFVLVAMLFFTVYEAVSKETGHTVGVKTKAELEKMAKDLGIEE